MANSKVSIRKVTQRTYDRLSPWYDLFSGSEKGIRQTALELLSPCPGESILEIGFGTGQSLPQLAGRVAVQGRVMGLDLSTGMARIAKARLAKEKQGGLVLLTVGDAACLPYPDGILDGMISTFTVELFDDAEIPFLLDECRRVLKPGGRIVIASLHKPALPNRMVSAYEWFHHTFPRLVDCHPIPAEQLISQAGFEILHHITRSIWGLPVNIVLGRKYGYPLVPT